MIAESSANILKGTSVVEYNTVTSAVVIINYWPVHVKKVKVSSYISQYQILRIAQSALHFTSLTDLFTQTPSRLLWEASSHMLQLMREGCSYTHSLVYRYSFIQLGEPEQCRVNILPKVLTPQHRIRTRVLLVESPTPYP